MSSTYHHTPKNVHPMERLYAWLSIDEKGNEGVVATIGGPIGAMVLVTGEERLAQGPMRDLALSISAETGVKVRLAVFDRRKEAV